jgi:hypothetical protein
MGGDEDNENDSDGQDPQKSKERYTPLWKYVTKLSEGKGGGTRKFICHHCHTEYTGSYTRVRKHLCGSMYWDEGKNIGIKACVIIDSKDRLKYQREEEVTQNKSKRPKGEHENARRMFIGRSASPHASAFSPSSSPRTISDFLTKGVGMMWIQKFTGFSMHVGYHSMFFAHLIGMKWFLPLMMPLKDTRALRMTRLEPVGLDHEKEKIAHALGKMTSSWNDHGVSIVSYGWTNVKGKPLISVLAVSTSGAIFLSAYDYSEKFKTAINIAEPLLQTIERIGPYNVIQVITDNAANCKAAGEIIKDRYPNIFWSGCLVHTMNLLMHDIIKMKDHITDGLVLCTREGRR